MLGWGGLAGLEHLLADDDGVAKPRDWGFGYGDDIEPLVRLMEETPLDKCVEDFAARLRQRLFKGRVMADKKVAEKYGDRTHRQVALSCSPH